MLAIQLIMPSEGDMALVEQKGGAIMLQPVFYGGECAGPHVQLVDVQIGSKGESSKPVILGRYRLRIKADGKVELKKGTTAEEGSKTDEG